MELSERLNSIVKHIEKTEILADIGTDHGYIPIYSIENEICNKAIAIDINKDPLDKARLNAIIEGVDDKIDFRLADGIKGLKKEEANVVVIAGMGGNLIRDILEESIGTVESIDYLILQPAQNPEILREYLYTNDYEVIKEDLCYDEEIYYEVFKVKRKAGESTILDSLYYEISPKLLMEKHPLMKDYLKEKVNNYKRIEGFIKEDTDNARVRKELIKEKINIISNMINFI